MPMWREVCARVGSYISWSLKRLGPWDVSLLLVVAFSYNTPYFMREEVFWTYLAFKWRKMSQFNIFWWEVLLGILCSSQFLIVIIIIIKLFIQFSWANFSWSLNMQFVLHIFIDLTLLLKVLFWVSKLTDCILWSK